MADGSVQKTGRQYGIDLLRIICMCMIPVLHVLGQGSVMVRTGTNDATYYSCWFLELICMCAVNCYALISGYVGLYSSFRLKKLIRMVLIVEFYSIVIGILICSVRPELITRDVVLTCLFPIQWKSYWYYSAYVGLFFLMPVLNRGVQGLSRKEKDRTLLSIFLIFCVLTVVCKTCSQDPFELIGGYSLIWLAVLYVFGACARDSRLLKLPRYVCAAGFFLCVWIAWIWKYLVEHNVIVAPEETSFARMFVTYTSPTIFLSGLFLFLFFANTQVRSSAGRGAIAILSPAAFYVYIIHTHPLIWENYLDGAFKSWRELPPYRCIPLVLVAALCIYITCTAVELLRSGTARLVSSIAGREKE